MTLQAKDLMIGDWVKDGNIYAQVTAITCDGIIETTHHPHSNIELIEPIPLTQEILEKNGWGEDYSERNFPEDMDFKLEISIEDKMVLWTINCNEYEIIRLSYVHELQHALKICKIEKQIEL